MLRLGLIPPQKGCRDVQRGFGSPIKLPRPGGKTSLLLSCNLQEQGRWSVKRVGAGNLSLWKPRKLLKEIGQGWGSCHACQTLVVSGGVLPPLDKVVV